MHIQHWLAYIAEWCCNLRPFNPQKYLLCDCVRTGRGDCCWCCLFIVWGGEAVVFILRMAFLYVWIGCTMTELSSLVCFSSQVMMSTKTISTFPSGSPDVRPCHIPGYNLMVLSVLLAFSYSALLTSGSVTVSASPCNTKKGSLTCYASLQLLVTNYIYIYICWIKLRWKQQQINLMQSVFKAHASSEHFQRCFQPWLVLVDQLVAPYLKFEPIHSLNFPQIKCQKKKWN